MSSVNKQLAGLKRLARQTENELAFCNCGTCRQNILQAEEILKSANSADCPMWALALGANLYNMAAIYLIEQRGMPPQHLQGLSNDLFNYLARTRPGMSAEQVAAFFNSSGSPIASRPKGPSV